MARWTSICPTGELHASSSTATTGARELRKPHWKGHSGSSQPREAGQLTDIQSLFQGEKILELIHLGRNRVNVPKPRIPSTRFFRRKQPGDGDAKSCSWPMT